MSHRLTRLVLLAGAGWLAASVASSASATAVVGPLAGAGANGDASGTFIIGCTTCPHGDITMSGVPSQSAGGPGASSAQVSYVGQGLGQDLTDVDYVAGGASFAAWAGFEGTTATPLARARASNDNEGIYRPSSNGPQFVGIDSYAAFANAGATQYYEYLGSASSSYTFHFRLDGTLHGEWASLGASAAVYAGDDPFLEMALAAGGAFVQGQLDTTTGIDESFSLTVTFDPGQAYYLRAMSSASMVAAFSSEDGWADAYSTLRVTGISGDSALLRSLIPGNGDGGGGSNVPLPGTLALLVPGLLAASASRRLNAARRRRAGTSAALPV